MELTKFLALAKTNTYATTEEDDENILDDGCKELKFSKGNFRYRDRYFGSDPFIGEEIIWKDDKIIWGMNYYGTTTSDIVPVKEIYGFLKTALQKITQEKPFRGPENFKNNDFEYLNSSKGDINLFKGEEIIKYKEKEVYKLHYHGGKI